nr:hypothetical protein [uncultured Lachnoclostridium sp.]
MKKIVELNEKDITEIIAAEFDVDVNDIKISYEKRPISKVDILEESSVIKIQIETECDVYDR